MASAGTARLSTAVTPAQADHSFSGVMFDGSDAPDFELGCVAHSDGDVVLEFPFRWYLFVVPCS